MNLAYLQPFEDGNKRVSRLAANIPLVVHGGARGADTLGGEWAAAHSIRVEVFPADWKRHRRSAGPRRTSRWPRLARTFVSRFPEGRGRPTWCGGHAAQIRVVAPLTT